MLNTLFRPNSQNRFSREAAKNPKILLRAPNWLGDCVMALPAIRALRDALPRATIAIEARPQVAPLFELCPEADMVLACPKSGGFRDFPAKFSHARQVAAMGFDLGVLLTNSFSTAFWMWLAQASRLVGTDASRRGVFLHRRVRFDESLRNLHMVEWYKKIADSAAEEFCSQIPAAEVCAPDSESENAWQASGLLAAPAPSAAQSQANAADAASLARSSGPAGEARPRLRNCSKAETESALARAGIVKIGRYVALAPVSAYGPAKDWPSGNYAELARRLVHEMGFSVLVTGTPADCAVCEQIASAAGKGVVSVAGKTNLRDFLAILSGATGFVGNDSGASHCAAALSLATVVIFGSTRAECTRPRGECVACLAGKAPCAPCMRRTCNRWSGKFECLLSITVEHVWDALFKNRLFVFAAGESNGRKALTP